MAVMPRPASCGWWRGRALQFLRSYFFTAAERLRRAVVLSFRRMRWRPPCAPGIAGRFAGKKNNGSVHWSNDVKKHHRREAEDSETSLQVTSRGDRVTLHAT